MARIRCSHGAQRHGMRTRGRGVVDMSTPSNPSPLPPLNDLIPPRNTILHHPLLSSLRYDEFEGLLRAGNSSRGGVRALRHCA